MAKAASINFQMVKSTIHAVAHASREVPPGYLIAPDKSMGSHCLYDSGEVHECHKSKMAKASRQALRQGDFSPLWEGVLNLPDKQEWEDSGSYKKRCAEAVMSFCDAYQTLTGHRVLRADLHLDEGHVTDSGEVILNPHAHVICDRTNDAGRVMKLDRVALRKVQDLAAQATGLQRGISAIVTGHKHLNHHAYRALAKANRLEVDKAVEKANTASLADQIAQQVVSDEQITQLKATLQAANDRIAKASKEGAQSIESAMKYHELRGFLKGTVQARQSDYSTLKEMYQTNPKGVELLAAFCDRENAVEEILSVLRIPEDLDNDSVHSGP